MERKTAQRTIERPQREANLSPSYRDDTLRLQYIVGLSLHYFVRAISHMHSEVSTLVFIAT